MRTIAFVVMACIAGSMVAAEEPAVTLTFEKREIRAALREIAEQTGINIGIRTNVRGHVTADLRDVPVRIALRRLLLQVDATYCIDGEVIRVRRLGEDSCRADWSPPPVVRD